MSMLIEVLVSFFLIAGAGFVLVGAIGLVRLPDVFSRLHAPTKASTLGVGAVLAGSLVYFTFYRGGFSIHELLVILFLFITAPVSANLLVKAAIQLGLDGDYNSKRERSD